MSQPEFFVRAFALDHFLALMQEVLRRNPDSAQRVERLRDPFRHLVLEDFLPQEFKAPLPDAFAQYLLYRAEDRSLSLMAMVVPPGVATPVHDHLAWGLVGVYQGEQQETVYRRLDDGSRETAARLEVVAVNHLRPGDVTTLLPPEGDIHKIETLSPEASISLHLLGNDIGCQWRHAFEPGEGSVRSFRSGYVNASCDEKGVSTSLTPQPPPP